VNCFSATAIFLDWRQFANGGSCAVLKSGILIRAPRLCARNPKTLTKELLYV
jgi:hypothetical protein